MLAHGGQVLKYCFDAYHLILIAVKRVVRYDQDDPYVALMYIMT